MSSEIEGQGGSRQSGTPFFFDFWKFRRAFPSESITLFWSPWGSKDSGCSKIKIAKVKACCYSTFTLAIYCFMDFATNVKKKKKKRPILLK